MKRKVYISALAVLLALTVVIIYHGSGLSDIKIISAGVGLIHFRHFAGVIAKLFQKIF